MSDPTLSQKLIRFSTQLGFSDIPADALTHAKFHVLDTIGICLAASGDETTQAVKRSMARLGTNPESSIIGQADRFSAAAAAMINSTAAHGPDFDDTHQGSVIHISSIVVPSSLAMAEAVGASGKDFLTAVTTGYETTTRLGMAAPGIFHMRGYHATALVGIFGTVLIAGKLQRLPEDVQCNALGIAGSQASGILECLNAKSSLKQIQPGWAAYSGIVATLLAQEGVTGPNTVFEGRYGFFPSFLPEGNYDLTKAVAGLGQKWEVNDIAYKLYPCCHHTQAFLDCIKELVGKNKFSLDEIEEIECIISPMQAELLCKPLEDRYAPKTAYTAKFSLPYVVSAMLHRGTVGLREFSDEVIGDAGILKLARKLRFTESDDTGYPGAFPGWVRIKLQGGRLLEHRMLANRGAQNNPASDAEIVGKYEDNASLVLPRQKVDRLRELVMDLENVEDIRTLAENMRP
ncbi:MmgE/PrpD family protein [Pseudorhodoferax sp.]|uniref:MmgE/PrpD family protein n=1 Tax=Pseudorhodoferax sp. TaxID=1993553 RepID=UPI0039E31656